MAKKCGFTGKKCTKHECMFFQQYRGINPNTGKDEDVWECSQVMIPVMLLENSKQLRSVAASAESSRNVVADALQSMPSEGVQGSLRALR